MSVDHRPVAELAITVGGSLSILLLMYRCFVRFTWIGALLSGRRHPRPERTSEEAAAKG